MITADMSASGSERISSGNNRLTVVSPLAGSNNAHGSEGETEEIGPPITHENAGGVEVVAKKAEAAARQSCRKKPCSHLMERKTDGHKTDSRDSCDARRQAIQGHPTS